MQVIQEPAGRGLVVRDGVDVSQVPFHRDMTLEEVVRPLQLLDRFRIPAFLLVGQPQVPAGQAVVGVEVERLEELGYRAVVVVGHHVVPAEMGVQDGVERVQLQRAPALDERFTGAPGGDQEMGIPVMRVGQVRVELEGSLELRLRARKVPIVGQLDEAQRVVRIGQPVVDRQRPGGRGLRPAEGLDRSGGGEVIGESGRGVAIGQTAVGDGVARVPVDGPLKALGGLEDRLPGPLVPEVAALQIELVGFGIHRPGGGEDGSLLGGQLRLDLARYRARDIVLQLEHVLHLPLVAIRPRVSVGVAPYQLRRDADAVPLAEHGPFDERVDAQLACDRGHRQAAALVARRRRARYDAERPDAGETRGQRVREAFGEVVLLRPAGKVLEGQHGEGADRRSSGGRPAKEGRRAQDHGDPGHHPGRP